MSAIESGPLLVVVFAGVGTKDLISTTPVDACAAEVVLLGADGDSVDRAHPEATRPTVNAAAARTMESRNILIHRIHSLEMPTRPQKNIVPHPGEKSDPMAGILAAALTAPCESAR